ncbi:MAG: hypothetical protein RIC19_19000 [Phaeodactylibacter sp.]|uniref:hypothetical protein n=1 Tax=Phaeodactylibacter sp. TaxID=1940289 RepID=UPI0032ECA74D
MNPLKLCIALLLLGNALWLPAQDLHIFYDVFEDTIYYQQNGKPVGRASIKKGQQVVLHVLNYNDYLYDLELETETEDFNIPASGSPFFGAGDNTQALAQFRNLTGGMGGTGFGLDGTQIANQGSGMVDQANVSASTKAMARRFASHLKAMEDIESDLQELNGYLKEELESQAFQQIALSEVQQLQQNPRLSPKRIKALSMDYMKPVLGVRRDEELDIGAVAKRANQSDALQNTVTDYEAEVSRLQLELQKLEASRSALFDAGDLPDMDRTALAVAYEAAALRVEDYEEKAKVVRSELSGLESLQLKELTELGYLYEEMKEHRFEQKFVFSPDSDLTTFRIKLNPVDSARLQGVRPKTLSPVKLNTYGGLKVNASVGVSFVRFFDRPQSYSVRDSLIVADDQDAFLPIISSFFHFYPQSQRQVSVGGTFGLGIGIGGDNAGLQTYFLGPSLILGQGQRVVFTTGLTGGKVERLAQGYQSGDVYDATVLPTKSVYEMGFFLGISFNIMGN